MTLANPAASDRELILTRTFNAPPALVYKAWTDPEMLKHWFVPRPWTIARAQTDVRPGGSSLIVMRDPEGKEYPNAGVYLEV
ncbi:MAG TPA: SRPBCC domain-containing protein, partial [Rhodocyclaceae bacterium]|nr:SRPBCC domain-containing protein [Rhodocyclaceae bacterium]